MSNYLILDGRAMHDRDAAAVYESLEADTDEEAIEHMEAEWDGYECVLINCDEPEGDGFVQYQEA